MLQGVHFNPLPYTKRTNSKNPALAFKYTINAKAESLWKIKAVIKTEAQPRIEAGKFAHLRLSPCQTLLRRGMRGQFFWVRIHAPEPWRSPLYVNHSRLANWIKTSLLCVRCARRETDREREIGRERERERERERRERERERERWR